MVKAQNLKVLMIQLNPEMNKDIIKLISFKEREKISKVIQVFNKTAPLTDSKGFGVVVNKSKKCIGVITDGDMTS